MTRYIRKVIKIDAFASPNVALALAEIEAGKEPSNRIIVPGVMPWADLQKRLATWDTIRIQIGVYANFYEGADVLLFPPDWLDRAERIAHNLRDRPRKAVALGVDPAEGGDKTAFAVVDELGLMELRSAKTPDTNVIVRETVDLMKRYSIPPERVVFDMGGGGKIHVNRLRESGIKVRTVAFGEPVSRDMIKNQRPGLFQDKLDLREERYVYKNRRAEMYGKLSILLDPANPGFGLPSQYLELRKQLGPIPVEWDREGRLILPPKRKKDRSDTRKTLTDLIGHSPDEADALVLAIHAMQSNLTRTRAGGLFKRSR